MADPPEREVGSGATGEEGNQKDGKTKLLALRRRMASEKRWIVDYLNTRRMEETLPEIRNLWNAPDRLEVTTVVPTMAGKLKEEWNLQGWNSWWNMVNKEADQARAARIRKASKTKEGHVERVASDKTLIGWRGWWSRMCAEAKRDQAGTKMISKTKPIHTYFDKVISKENQAQGGQLGWRGSSSSLLSLGKGNIILKTPKRKQFLQPLMGESPGKKRKLSPVFAEKLLYWREREKDVPNTHRGPTISAVRDFSKHFSKHNLGPDQSEQVKVVTQRVSPGQNESTSEWINFSGGGGNLDRDKYSMI